MLDCVASERHFLDHLRPIWNAFPVERKGVFLVPGHLVEYAKSRGIESVAFERSSVVGKVLTPASSVLVSSFRDLKVAQQAHHPTIFSEHGAGQSYSSAHSSYAGGEGRLGVRLFLVPGDHPAERNRRAHPGIPVAVVGCPKLDRWHPAPPWKRPQRPVVAMSFHWDCRIVPETRSAWEHFRGALSDLATDPRWTLIGHGHPRIIEQLRPHYQAAGVEVLADFDEVLERADCYICDNSCVTPETPVLCADLLWRPAGSLQPGDKLIGCDEERFRNGRLRDGRIVDREDRRFRTVTVQSNELRPMACVEVTTAKGTLTVSRQHPWLTRRPHPYVYQDPKTGWTYHRKTWRWEWVNTSDLSVGDEVAYLGDPWVADQSREAGWLAGMMDGEGNLSITPQGRPVLSVAQNPGPVLNELSRQLAQYGNVTDQVCSGKACHKLTLGGNLTSKLRFLGSVRPMRVLSKAIDREIWEGANVSAVVQSVKVTGLKDVGERVVAVLGTDHRTFIADGFMAHNSTLFEFASTGRPVVVLNSPHYRRNIHHGLRFWECATVGVQVANPDHLVDGVALALEDFETQQEARKRAVARVYKYTDRHATVRAVNAILEVLTVPEHEKPQNPASVRMIANQTFVAPEGRIPKNAEFYPNCVLSRGGWKRIYTGYDLPQRVRWFENRGLARIAPPIEAKVVTPAEVKEGFSCAQCGRQFPSAASLRGHLTRVHGGA